MSFIVLKKKRYKFQVDLCLEELSEVSYSRGIMFAKVRQLDGGSFADVSKRMDIKDHRVKYSARFQFPCKMHAPVSTGVLEACKCRISIRMEEKGGRNFRKLGFVDINLAEYAAVGPSTQRYILQPYDQHHRLDNSIVQVSINVTLREGDPVFQRPLTRQQPITLPGEESFRKDTAVAAMAASNAAIPAQGSNPSSIDPVTVNDSGGGGASATDLVGTPLGLALLDDDGGARSGIPFSGQAALAPAAPSASENDLSHTRNSSSTSQASAGYASQQSFGPVAAAPPPSSTATLAAASPSTAVSPPHPASTSTPTAAATSMASAAQQQMMHSQGLVASGPSGAVAAAGHSRQSSSGESSSHGRNLSQGSSDTGIGYGSMEKEKRRKAKLDEGRVDAELVINELMEGIELDKHNFEEDGESSGLQLYVAKDGTVTFDKGSSRDRELKPVVVTGNSKR